jgi:hypothetical protein
MRSKLPICLVEMDIQQTANILGGNANSANCQYAWLKCIFNKLPICLAEMHIQQTANMLG